MTRGQSCETFQNEPCSELFDNFLWVANARAHQAPYNNGMEYLSTLGKVSVQVRVYKDSQPSYKFWVWPPRYEVPSVDAPNFNCTTGGSDFELCFDFRC